MRALDVPDTLTHQVQPLTVAILQANAESRGVGRGFKREVYPVKGLRGSLRVRFVGDRQLLPVHGLADVDEAAAAVAP